MEADKKTKILSLDERRKLLKKVSNRYNFYLLPMAETVDNKRNCCNVGILIHKKSKEVVEVYTSYVHAENPKGKTVLVRNDNLCNKLTQLSYVQDLNKMMDDEDFINIISIS